MVLLKLRLLKLTRKKMVLAFETRGFKMVRTDMTMLQLGQNCYSYELYLLLIEHLSFWKPLTKHWTICDLSTLVFIEIWRVRNWAQWRRAKHPLLRNGGQNGHCCKLFLTRVIHGQLLQYFTSTISFNDIKCVWNNNSRFSKYYCLWGSFFI